MVEKRDTCDLCGYESILVAVEKHRIVPKEITEKAGVGLSKAVRLCSNCQRELHAWYSSRVVNTAYDPKTKHFRVKSSLEMVKEYESAFDGFVKFKR